MCINKDQEINQLGIEMVRLHRLFNYYLKASVKTEVNTVGYQIWCLLTIKRSPLFKDFILKANVEKNLSGLLEEHKDLIWALENNCLGEDVIVEECDNCGRLTCRPLARVFSDELVVCCWCD
jgi:hypothetical protein